MLTSCQVFHVASFTDRTNGGNPAAVILLTSELEQGVKQKIATKVNQSETSFVYLAKDGIIDIQWFSPTGELSLCGHGTVAALHVLNQLGLVERNKELSLRTVCGILKGKVHCDGSSSLQLQSTPLYPTTEDLAVVLESLNLRNYVYAGRNEHCLLIEIPSENGLVENIQPDFKKLAKIESGAIIVCNVASPSKKLSLGVDFVSRFFSPACGLDEDYVTGCSHCTLGPHFSKKLGKDSLVGHQASSRGGEIKVQVLPEGLTIQGKCITLAVNTITV